MQERRNSHNSNVQLPIFWTETNRF